MKIYRYIGYLFFAFAASIMSACTDEDMLGESGDSVNITFRPSLGGELNTRGKSSVSCPLKPSDSAPLC